MNMNTIVEKVLSQSEEVTSTLGVTQDITEQMQVAKKLHSIAYYDTFTGLPNRVRFYLSNGLDADEVKVFFQNRRCEKL